MLISNHASFVPHSHTHTHMHYVMNENSLMTEPRPGPVGECFCLSVRGINRAWFAQQAHQTTREHREMTKAEVEKEEEKEGREEGRKKVSFFSILSSCPAIPCNNKTTTSVAERGGRIWQEH